MPSPNDHPAKRPRMISAKLSVSSSLKSDIDNNAARTIPPSQHYQVSYAHRSAVTCTVYSSKHDMILTASQDGIVKFWKRTSTSSPTEATATAAQSQTANQMDEPSGQCVEFIKSYVAHTSPIRALVLSQPDGDFAASIGQDNVIKFYDVGGFDVTGMIRVKDEYPCGRAAAFIGEQQSLLAVSSAKEKNGFKGSVSGSGSGIGAIYIFSMITLSPKPVKELSLHAAPIITMKYNFKFHCMISADQKGVIEYWNGSMLSQVSSGNSHSNNALSHTTTVMDDYDAIDDVGNDDIAARDDEKVSYATFASLGDTPVQDRNGVLFQSKFETDLYSLLKKKSYAISLAISPNGEHFAVYGSDRKIRLFDFKSGKSIVQYDERMKVYDAQLAKRQAAGAGETSNGNGMDVIDYGNRAAREKEMSDTTIMCIPSKLTYQECGNQSLVIQFDPTGRYLFVPTIIGVKVIEWSTNKCRKVIGKGDASTLRFLGGCMCLGDAKVDKQMLLARAANSVTDTSGRKADEKTIPDSLFITTAFNKRRLYIFSHLDPIADGDDSGDSEMQQHAIMSRDILNEPPDADDLMLDHMDGKDKEEAKLGKEAILRTTMGDIHIRLFPEETPRTVENFCGHAKSGYYDNVIFHRVIKSFMLQTGDPLGDGTGGESIWGGEFEDEFVRDLRHDRPFTVSMANAGPGTNGSQFFITTVPTPWLDNKHTVFGRVTRGMDVCSAIDAVKCDELDKPLNEISIISVDVH